MAFDVLKYIKEKETNTDNGRSSTYYQDRYDYLTKNAMDFYEQYGKTEYDRYANYYGTKAQIERYGINQNDFAPSYALLDDLIENRSQYNEKDWKSTYAMADSLVKSESSNLNAAFKMKEKGLYSADLLNSYDWMSQWGYTDDPEDVMRQKLGYAPIALDNAAKDIVKRAEEYKEADRKKNLTPEEKEAELRGEIMPEKTDWTVFESANAPITEEELREAIKVLGEGQNREKEQRQAILQNPLTPMTTKEYAARQLYAQGTGVQNRSTDERENPIISATVGTDGGTYDLNSLVQNPVAATIDNAAQQLLDSNIAAINEYYDKKAEEIKNASYEDKDMEYLSASASLLSKAFGQKNTAEDQRTKAQEANEKERQQALKNEPYFVEDQKTQALLETKATQSSDFEEKATGYIKESKPVVLTDLSSKSDKLKFAIHAYAKSLETGTRAGMPGSNYGYLTPEQIKTAAYYMATDEDKAIKYVDSLDRVLNSESAKARQERIESVGGTPLGDIGLAVASVLAAPAQVESLIGSGIDSIGEYKPTDPNKAYNATAKFVSGAREEATKDMSDTAKFFANIGFSAADMAVSLPAGPNIGPAIMALSAAGSASNDALQRGGTTGQAFFSGLASGAIEYATEAISFGNLDKIAKGATKQTAKQVAANILKQAGIEGSEEVISSIGNAIADNIIMGDKSKYNQTVLRYIAQGMSEEAAANQANKDFFFNDVAMSFASGALLGGLFGAGAEIKNVRSNAQIDAAMNAAGIDTKSMTETELQDAREQFYNAAVAQVESHLDPNAETIQITKDGEIAIPEIPTMETRGAAETQGKPAKVVNADESALPLHARNDLGPTSNNIISESAQNVNAQSTRDAIDTINSKILSENIKDTKLVKTIMKALDIKPPIDAKFKADLEAMASTYQTTDNKTQKKIARQFVEQNFENAERYIKESAVLQTAADAAIVSEIVDKYRQTGRADEALAMIRHTANKFSKAGQFVQSAAIWSEMTPEGVIKGIERAIEKANAHTDKQFALDVKDGKYIMDAVDRSASMDAQELSDLFIEIAKKRGRKLGKATYGELESLVKKSDTATLKNAVIQNLTLTVMDKVPRSLGQKTSTIQAFRHLISVKTALRNITSNTIFKYQEMVADYSAVIFDMFMSLKTKQRTVAAPSPKNIRQSTEAGLEYARRSMFEIQTGVSLDDAQGKYDLFSLETFPTNKVRGRIERLLGYELKTPDQFAKGAVEISEIRKQLALQGVDVDGKTIDEIVEMADDETIKIAKEQALYNTFQNNGFIAGSMREFKKLLNRVGINKGDFGLGDLVIKYPVVPGNLIQRGIDYTPIGALKVLRYIGQKNITRTQQRYMAKAFGRAVTGTTMIAIGYWLSNLGVIVSPPDDNKREKAFFEDAGLSGRKLNISAVGRLLEGKEATIQDGDTLLSFDFLETINAHLSVGHEIATALPSDDLPAKIGNTFAEEILDMPTMSIINSIVYTGMKEDSAVWDVLAVPFTQAIPGFIPAPIRQAAAAADSLQRDRKGIEESIMFNTPARGSLPAKLGTFGQELKQDSGVIQFFNPGKSSTYLPLKFTKELKRLADKYSDYEIYPSGVTVKAFNLNGKRYELNEVEQRGFMTLYGDMLADSYDIILTSSLSDDEKISKLKEYQTVIKNYVKDHYAFKKGD